MQTNDEPVVMPDVSWPDDLPASRWEAHVDEAILAANGFPRDRDAWRRATASRTKVLRDAAYHLLAAAPSAADTALFRRGLNDPSDTAQAHSAYALALLHDRAGREVLTRLIHGKVEFGGYGPLVAAGLLARLGDASGFPTVRAAMDALTDQAAVMPHLLPFIDLQGQSTAGQPVDVWPLYARALAGDDQLQAMALGQFAEKPHQAELPLLTDYLARGPSPTKRAQAERLLARLRAIP